MSIRPIVLLFIFHAFVPATFSQEAKNRTADSLSKKPGESRWNVKTDSLFVHDNSNLLSITLPFASTYINVDLKDKRTNKVLQYRPHGDMTVGLDLSYKFLGLGYSVSTGSTAANDKTFGQTRYTDYSIGLSGHMYTLDLYYEDFQGFYLYNYKTFPQTSKADTSRIFPQRSDMRTLSVGGAFNYIQNYKKFSYKAAFGNSEEQLKSAGSFLFGTYVSNFDLSADSGLVFGKFKHSLSGYSNIDHSRTFNAGFCIGYIYTLVLKHHWYATLALNPGLSYLYYDSHAFGPTDTTKLSKDSTWQVKTSANLGFRLQSRFALGYNSPKWYMGINLAGDAFFQNVSITRSSLDYKVGSIRFYFGYRFNVPCLNKIWSKHSSGQHINIDAGSST